MKSLLSRLLVLVLVAGALGACSDEPKTGPEEVHWDRDMCELCRMALSDASHVAEVRGGPGRKVYKFDDIGCAINWLNGKPWAAAAETEIWVADHRTSSRQKVDWLDAREAWYVTGALTPMNYGFSAQKDEAQGAVDFGRATDAVLANAPNHICPARQ